MNQVLDIAKALGDESRLRALLALRDGELCLCQIIDVIELAPSTVSKHLSILHRAGLVQRRKQGKWHYYRLAGRDASPVARRALRWVTDALSDDPAVAADADAFERVRCTDPAELCGCYR